MTKQNIKTKEGFTIIEVVLVLAIAGLIFLMVFVALPALQRSQRDTARRSDIARVSTALTQWQTNNASRPDNLPGVDDYTGDDDLPSCSDGQDADCFVLKYMNDAKADANEFADPDGAYYSVTVRDQDPTQDIDGATFDEHMIFIVKAAKCDGEGVAMTENQTRNYAVLYRLEGAGVYCVDNQ